MPRKAIFLLYRALEFIGSPVILLYLALRAARNPRWLPTLPERLGFLPPSWQQTVMGAIWLHAVSVGEVIAAIPLLEEVKRRAPHTPIFVSTATLAGRDTAGKRLGALADGVFFAPLDFVWIVRSVLRRLRPSLVVVLETEIWPNLFREAQRLGCGLAIVNGRISERALPRYRRHAWFFGPVLGLCDRIITQSEEMTRRFREAGAPARILEMGGNLKYDFVPRGVAADSPVRAFLEAAPGRPVWIAASTCADGHVIEEDAVLAAQKKLAGWRLILAPRKPERFEDAAARLTASGLRWTRRTDLSDLRDAAADILLLDSIGELSGLFGEARVVFMGGTLANHGGHNILEPALFGTPVVAGPHMENFREIAAEFERRNALPRIASGAELAGAILSAAADEELGERARAAGQSQQGAASHAADVLMALYDSKYPATRRPQPVYAFLWLLAQIWKSGSAADRRRKLARRRRLPVPVVSVGNITAGGTGKTPMTIELLHGFQATRPGLLSRGYGRETSETLVLLEGNRQITVSRAGDEALLCHRAANAPVGIGPDRFTAGVRLLEKCDARLLLLDDGFQHIQLERDFDLVMIDALNPFGNGELLPLGRLREPLEGLARANAFVITRTREAPNLAAIKATLARWNPAAPVFEARVVPLSWVDVEGVHIAPEALAGAPAVAFCGLGNPESFWRTLKRLGIEPLDRHAWNDHHRYTPAELRRLARHALDIGANVLLATAKDAVNLDPDYALIVEKPLKLYWLEIGLEIEGREELFALIQAAVNARPVNTSSANSSSSPGQVPVASIVPTGNSSTE